MVIGMIYRQVKLGAQFLARSDKLSAYCGGHGNPALYNAYHPRQKSIWEIPVATSRPMTGGSTPSSFARPRPFPAIFVGGMFVGVVDLAYAILVYSPKNPLLIPRHIATGVLGVKSYSGGLRTAALGVILHFTIALGAATVYYLASRKLPFLVTRAVLCGMIYGALVYLFMHYVVLPLSAVPKGHATRFIYQATEFVEHWFCVGLPIALSVRHYSRGREEQ
jgi:hypothetical protein